MSNPSRRVVITQHSFDLAATAYLDANGCEVVAIEPPQGHTDGDLSHGQLLEMLKGAAGWIPGHAHVTRRLLEALPELRIVARRGVGYDRVDVEAARALGLVVTISAGGNDASVADHALALMLAVARRLREQQMAMLAGNWPVLLSSDLNRKTVGIVGLGRIGRGVVKRLSGFEARVLAVSAHPDEAYARASGVSYVDFETLLRESDFVSLHVPFSSSTRNMIDRRMLALMKPTAVLVNTARGGLVDERDLLDALKSGRIAGAGLDVFASESDPALKPVTAELIALANVVATPHSAGASVEGVAHSNMIASQNVVAVLDGGTPPALCLIADGRPRRAG
jgi:D-3-phosphoglycerate dehydrogenase